MGVLGEEKWLGKPRGLGETLAGHEENPLENEGEVMGCGNPHSKGQSWAWQRAVDEIHDRGAAAPTQR